MVGTAQVLLIPHAASFTAAAESTAPRKTRPPQGICGLFGGCAHQDTTAHSLSPPTGTMVLSQTGHLGLHIPPIIPKEGTEFLCYCPSRLMSDPRPPCSSDNPTGCCCPSARCSDSEPRPGYVGLGDWHGDRHSPGAPWPPQQTRWPVGHTKRDLLKWGRPSLAIRHRSTQAK